MGRTVAACSAGAMILISSAAGAVDALQVRVRQEGETLVVTNTGRVPVTDCYVTANSQFKKSGLSFQPGEPTRLPAAALLTGSGTRYNLAVDGLQRLHIQCFKPTNADISMAP